MINHWKCGSNSIILSLTTQSTGSTSPNATIIFKCTTGQYFGQKNPRKKRKDPGKKTVSSFWDKLKERIKNSQNLYNTTWNFCQWRSTFQVQLWLNHGSRASRIMEGDGQRNAFQPSRTSSMKSSMRTILPRWETWLMCARRSKQMLRWNFWPNTLSTRRRAPIQGHPVRRNPPAKRRTTDYLHLFNSFGLSDINLFIMLSFLEVDIILKEFIIITLTPLLEQWRGSWKSWKVIPNSRNASKLDPAVPRKTILVVWEDKCIKPNWQSFRPWTFSNSQDLSGSFQQNEWVFWTFGWTSQYILSEFSLPKCWGNVHEISEK